MVCSSTHSLVPIIHAHLFYSVHGLLFATCINKRYTASDAILIRLVTLLEKLNNWPSNYHRLTGFYETPLMKLTSQMTPHLSLTTGEVFSSSSFREISHR